MFELANIFASLISALSYAAKMVSSIRNFNSPYLSASPSWATFFQIGSFFDMSWRRGGARNCSYTLTHCPFGAQLVQFLCILIVSAANFNV